jgi:hypothetical protein
MKIDDLIDDPTEALMSDTPASLRYSYQPSAAFATTLAGAARRADQAAAAATQTSANQGLAAQLLRRISAVFAASSGGVGAS